MLEMHHGPMESGCTHPLPQQPDKRAKDFQSADTTGGALMVEIQAS